MKRKVFKTEIIAPREKIWEVLWNDKTYRQWTTPFMEGSYAKTDWLEGSKVLFLGPDDTGMVSRIKTNKPNEFMSIEHLGIVKDGAEDTDSTAAKQWAGIENYTLKTVEDGIILLVETDIPEEYLEGLEKSWSKALEKVKELAQHS